MRRGDEPGHPSWCLQMSFLISFLTRLQDSHISAELYSPPTKCAMFECRKLTGSAFLNQKISQVRKWGGSSSLNRAISQCRHTARLACRPVLVWDGDFILNRQCWWRRRWRSYCILLHPIRGTDAIIMTIKSPGFEVCIISDEWWIRTSLSGATAACVNSGIKQAAMDYFFNMNFECWAGSV